ncbi:hypothetical protein [Luteolibacter sp. AS25]|uniref:hypothetical protein n=1 Tax=Luteolibacter sp. AS25 TaxID=3135776 RepID=UPI00398B75E3
MKTIQHLFTLLATLFVALSAVAELPPSHTPPAPAFKAAEAAKLADDYIAKTFPQYPELYCSELSYESQLMKVDKSVIWRLRYIIPKNPGRTVEGSPHLDWGVCLVFVHEDKSVTHTAQPKRNPIAEQEGEEPPAIRFKSR